MADQKPSSSPSPVDILDMTDEDLIKRGILRVSETAPFQAWIFFILSFIFFCVSVGSIVSRYDVRWAILFIALGLLTGFLTVFVVMLKILFMMNRQQLEIRILASDLPKQAAGIIVQHMTPGGLK